MKKNYKKIFKNIFPWIITLGIFALLFNQIPPKDVFEVAKKANLSLMILISIFYFFLMMIWDVAGLKWCLNRFVCPINFKEVFLMRGVTYILMLLNYNVSQGGMAFYLKRTFKASLSKSLSSIFFFSFLDLLIISCCAYAAFIFKPSHFENIKFISNLKLPLSFFVFFLLMWIFFWKNIHQKWFQHFFKFRIVRWILNHNLFDTFREAKFRDYIIAITLRLVPVFLVIFCLAFILYPFGSYVPLLDILFYTPIILVISVLPITPGGLGTTHALIVLFFSGVLTQSSTEFKPEQILLASSLIWTFLNLSLKVIAGLICLKFRSSHLFKALPEA